MKNRIIKLLDRNNLVVYPISYYNIFRGLTKWFRINPIFLIIGASRCGTTALYDYLTKNIDGFPAPVKELHFFDQQFEKGVTWYRGNFPTIFHKFYLEKLRNRKIIAGEASARYLHNPFVAKRIAKTMPDVKLIVMFRNPVDRTYSHYSRRFVKGGEHRSFEQVVNEELTFLEQKHEPKTSKDVSTRYMLHPYLSRSLYYNELKVWAKYFPKSQILVIKSEDFFKEPHEVLRKVYDFLGKKNIDLEKILDSNVNRNKGGSDVKMDQNIRKKLIEFFKPYNEKLNKFWNIDFSWE